MIKLPSLHCNTEFSFQESSIRIDNLIDLAKKEKLTSLVITDHNNMFGAFEFIEKCKSNGIKPVIGLDLDVEDYRLILLAKNYAGFCELSRISSKKMKKENILLRDIDFFNLFVIDHPVHGYFHKNKKQLKINNYFVSNVDNYPNSVLVEETKIINIEENEALGILEAQVEGREFRTCNYKPYVFSYDPKQVQVKQMEAIINDCNLVIPANVSFLPMFKNPDNISSNDYLKKIIASNFKKMFTKEVDTKYLERLKSEFLVIEKLNFADYFLIIWDLISWAKANKILIGPGRGSAAGSLIAYILNITEVDPLKFDLLFERFLNVERNSMPDIDIDIQDSRRAEVVDYVFKKYGVNEVAQISTFSRLGPKSAIRDVARVMKIPNRDVDNISKLLSLRKIPSGEEDISLKTIYNKSVQFRALIDASSEYTWLYKRASLIEGLPRQLGTHPAGVVISSENLSNKFPVTNAGTEMINQLQMPLDYLEKYGLLKIDLLSLRNLTILKSIEQQIFKRYKRRVNLQEIPLDDKLTNELLSDGEVNGIFQLEGYGMRATLMEIGVDTFDDLVAIISLHRPGPMAFESVYANRKKGIEQVPVVNKVFDEITKTTFGILIYQEQIMKIVQHFAGLSFAQADIFRRAISKKEAKELTDLKTLFINGSIKNGFSEELAGEIFNLISKFANYGFNKSHAVAYGVLAYRMAYLKARFPIEFYAALLESNLGSQEAISKYVGEAKRKGIAVVSPSISSSVKEILIEDNKIILPLTIIKGFGQANENKIIEVQKGGAFKDFYDAIIRLTLADVGDATIQTLIEANAMKEFGNTQELSDARSAAIRYAGLNTHIVNGVKERISSILPSPRITRCARNIADEMTYEKNLYGFLLNAFPTSGFSNGNLLLGLKINETKPIVVYYENVRIMKDKFGNDYALIKVSDESGAVEVSAFSNIWKFIEVTKKKTLVEAHIMSEMYNNKITYKLVKPWEEIKND